MGMLSIVKVWLATSFDTKDLEEASYILGIKLFRDQKQRIIGLSQDTYIEAVLSRFSTDNSKKGLLPFRHGLAFSRDQCPKTQEERDRTVGVPYASAVGSLMYAMLYTRLDICFAIGIVTRYQSNPCPKHWIDIKHILKYLRRTKDYMLMYGRDELIPISYTDSNFTSDKASRKSTSGYVFTLGGGAVSWMSIKQKCIVDSTIEVEYVTACEASKEAAWLKKFLMELGVVPASLSHITLYCDNCGALA